MNKLTDAAVLSNLQALGALKKYHYVWEFPDAQLVVPADSVVVELARVCNSVVIGGVSATAATVRAAVSICNSVNALAPTLPCHIAVKFSPWHRVWPQSSGPTETGIPEYAQEKSLHQASCTNIKTWLDAANLEFSSSVDVGVMLYDSEVWAVSESDVTHNAAIDARHDEMYDIAKAVFPSVQIERFGHGGFWRTASVTGWSQEEYYTLNEKKDSLSCRLYTIPEIGYMREVFNKTVDEVAEVQSPVIQPVTAWVALSAGYKRKTVGFHQYSRNWRTDPVYSWQLGAELNNPWYGDRPDRFAQWHRSEKVVFFPGPFSDLNPHWMDYFIAYAKGGNGDTDLAVLDAIYSPVLPGG